MWFQVMKLKAAPHWVPHAGCGSVGWQVFYSLWGVQSDEIKGFHAGKGAKLHEKWLSTSTSSVLSYFHTNSRESKARRLRLRAACFSFSLNFFRELNNRTLLLMQKSIWSAKPLPLQQAVCPKTQPKVKSCHPSNTNPLANPSVEAALRL